MGVSACVGTMVGVIFNSSGWSVSVAVGVSVSMVTGASVAVAVGMGV